MKGVKKSLIFVFMMCMLVLGIGMSVSAASKIKINKKTVTLYPTQKVSLKVTGTKLKVKWSSNHPKIAKVSNKGKVTAVKAGKAVIKAKVGNKTYSCKVTVKKPALSVKKLTLAVGEKETVKLYGARIKSVSSSDKAVASVTKKGIVTAKKPGKSTIAFKDSKGKKYTCKVTVNAILAADISLNKTAMEINEGDSETLTATVTPANATNKAITWKSSDTTVATVNEEGLVTAVSAGVATITASTDDGSNLSVSCTVNVTALGSVTQPETGGEEVDPTDPEPEEKPETGGEENNNGDINLPFVPVT